MKYSRITLVTIALSIAAVTGGATVAATAGGSIVAVPSSSTGGQTAGSTAPTVNPVVATLTTRTGKAATIQTATDTVGGASKTILVNAQGLPLYFYKPDTSTQSMVSGELAALWPPLLSRAPSATGVKGTLKVANTSNGHQVTYNGHFLYTFAQDSPGHVTGQGVQNFFVVTPGISARHTVTSPATTPAPARYGY
jgi:predicted lipoprotein with Yx(FWY)xxD motif